MSTNEKRIWDYLTGKGLSPAGAAGLWETSTLRAA